MGDSRGDSSRWEYWRDFLRRVARVRFGLPAEAAEDVVQEALTKMFVHPPISEDPRAITAFALQVVRRAALDWMRRNERGPRPLPLDRPPAGESRPLSDRTAVDDPTPEERAAAAERLACVRAHLARLATPPPRNAARDVEVFVRAVVRGESTQDLARHFALTEANVNLIVHRIRQALKRALQGDAP